MEQTPRGRRRVFDAQKQQDLVKHVAQGVSVDEAAFCVGVTLRTVQRAAKFCSLCAADWWVSGGPRTHSQLATYR